MVCLVRDNVDCRFQIRWILCVCRARNFSYLQFTCLTSVSSSPAAPALHAASSGARVPTAPPSPLSPEILPCLPLLPKLLSPDPAYPRAFGMAPPPAILSARARYLKANTSSPSWPIRRRCSHSHTSAVADFLRPCVLHICATTTTVAVEGGPSSPWVMVSSHRIRSGTKIKEVDRGWGGLIRLRQSSGTQSPPRSLVTPSSPSSPLPKSLLLALGSNPAFSRCSLTF
jgi:hypothetical protein